MKKALITLSLALLMVSCQTNQDPSAPKFHVKELVQLNGINPEKSYIPLPGGVKPLRIFNLYGTYDNTFWFYDTVDAKGDTLTHLYQDQLKKY
jgi:hypothetical protein